jgi:hypothetical protein
MSGVKGSSDAIYGRPGGLCTIRVSQHSRDNFKRFLVKAFKQQKKIDISLKLSGMIDSLESGGVLVLKASKDNFSITITPHRERRSLSQNDTLRGLERFIYWAENGVQATEEEMYYIHEALVEKYSVPVTNPINGKTEQKRTSDPTMTTSEMARIIEGAINELSSMDIPDEILESAEEEIGNLFKNWYKWIDSEEGQAYLKRFPIKTWEEYCARHPVCEFCGVGGSNADPLERIHIITKGAREDLYKKPWNWIRGHHRHHVWMHNKGWEEVLKEYPHMRKKVEQAFKNAMEEEL